MPEEHILVIKRELLDRLGAFQGLRFEIEEYLAAMLDRSNNFFAPRGRAETDPSLKQIIPYALLVHGDRVLHYVRGKKAGEQRLVAKGSIGIGGHMNNEDETLFNMGSGLDRAAYFDGVLREINEELRLNTGHTGSVVALLNDDSNEVGRVHLGVVHVFHLESDDVAKGESMITDLQFLNRDQLAARRGTMETWSQICFDNLDALLDASA